MAWITTNITIYVVKLSRNRFRTAKIKVRVLADMFA